MVILINYYFVIIILNFLYILINHLFLNLNHLFISIIIIVFIIKQFKLISNPITLFKVYLVLFLIL
jgi:hypothetical protein